MPAGPMHRRLQHRRSDALHPIAAVRSRKLAATITFCPFLCHQRQDDARPRRMSIPRLFLVAPRQLACAMLAARALWGGKMMPSRRIR